MLSAEADQLSKQNEKGQAADVKGSVTQVKGSAKQRQSSRIGQRDEASEHGSSRVPEMTAPVGGHRGDKQHTNEETGKQGSKQTRTGRSSEQLSVKP